MKSPYLAGLVSGFAGGLLGAYLFVHPGRSDVALPAAGSAQPAAATDNQRVISAARMRLLDSAGRARAELAMSGDGGPALFFYDTGGRIRLVLGLYSPAESEYPFVVLNDTDQNAAGIFRLYGGRETPVVVLKNKGRDRSIYGLNPNSTEPFLVTYHGDGGKTDVFGIY
jgi:hypothetical protein